jgi:molybdopterin-biosynthesis enzyme MoeA-like protein
MEKNSFVGGDIAFICVNEQILFGVKSDNNLEILAKILATKGRYICEARFIPNVPSKIIENIKELKEKYHIVIIAGSVGVTYDCHTAECVANVFNCELEESKEAKDIHSEYLNSGGLEYTDSYKKAVCIPKNSVIIPNKINGIAGFSYANVFVLVSRIDVFKAMAEWIAIEMCSWYKYILQSINTDLPISQFWEKLWPIALNHGHVKIGVEDIDNDNSKIVLRSTDFKTLETCALDIEDMLSFLKEKT